MRKFNGLRRDVLKGTGASLLALSAGSRGAGMQITRKPARKALLHCREMPTVRAHEMVARGRSACSFTGASTAPRPPRMGDGERRHSRCGVRAACQKLSSPSRMPRALGPSWPRQAGMKYMVMTTKHHEGFCNFDYEADRLLRAQAGPRPRSGAGVRGGRARRRTARRLLLLADGLASS